jgi:hypothetical protein
MFELLPIAGINNLLIIGQIKLFFGPEKRENERYPILRAIKSYLKI